MGSASTKSLHAARPRPPPMAAPRTKLSTGAGKAARPREHARQLPGVLQVPVRPGRGLLLHVAQVRPGAEHRALALQQQQAQARRRAGPPARARTWVISWIIWALKALRTWGRSSTRRATPWARASTRMVAPAKKTLSWGKPGRGGHGWAPERDQFAGARLILGGDGGQQGLRHPTRTGAGPGPGSCPGRPGTGSRCRLRPGSPPGGSSGPRGGAPGGAAPGPGRSPGTSPPGPGR